MFVCTCLYHSIALLALGDTPRLWTFLTLSLPKANFTKPGKLLNPNCPTKPKGVKALDEYFLMVVLTLLPNTVHAFATTFCLIWTEKHGSERVNNAVIRGKELLTQSLLISKLFNLLCQYVVGSIFAIWENLLTQLADSSAFLWMTSSLDGSILKVASQSCAVAKSETFWRATGQSTWRTNGWLQQKLPMFGFRTHTTALSPMEHSSVLSAKFDCRETRQNCSLRYCTWLWNWLQQRSRGRNQNSIVQEEQESKTLTRLYRSSCCAQGNWRRV